MPQGDDIAVRLPLKKRITPFLRTEIAGGGEIKEKEMRSRDWKVDTGRGTKMILSQLIPSEAEISYKAGPES